MPHWLIPANWTPEWVSAIGGSAAAVFALIALIVTLSLSGRQAKSLKVTINALNDEMEWRHQERERQKAEAQERKATQAAQVGIIPIHRPPSHHGSLRDHHSKHLFDGPRIGDFLSKSGVSYGDVRLGFRIDNNSQARITNVAIAQEHGHGPRCYIVDFEPRAGGGSAPVLPPGESVRFYWVEPVSDLQVHVDFTDAAGVRWRLHHRDGLSELTGQE
ncbi:hypothetical protein ABZ234_03530 [Nocardiopsis sp. NPDC006198]|uniref:hypothetical protein n=1 Tax=Nocardiopsis sp. NPDC006198 TaxID=3154472 RepID=UPI0033A34401